MSPKSKFLLLLLLVVMVGFAVIAAWAMTELNWVAYLIFPWLFVATWILQRVACPRCGAPVTYSARVGKTRIMSAIPRRECGQCGLDLTK